MRFTTNRFKRFEFDEAKQYKKYLHAMCCVLAKFYRERAGQQALAASVINHPAGRKVRHTSVQVSFTFIVQIGYFRIGNCIQISIYMTCDEICGSGSGSRWE